MIGLGLYWGEGYKYAHDYDGHHVEQEYLSTNKIYYEPTNQGQEAQFQEYLKKIGTRTIFAPRFSSPSVSA